MKLLAHRGYWKKPAERNSEQALHAAFDHGYGVETDLRDYAGRVVISHDVADATAMPLEALLDMQVRIDKNAILALNIKADGLCDLVRAALIKFDLQSYFCFDMSVPDTLSYIKAGLNVFTRRSEFETGSTLDRQARGLWLDSFDLPFVPPRLLTDVLASGQAAVLVSPELHGKPHHPAWSEWRDVLRRVAPPHDRVMLCTDIPDEAEVFFRGS